MRAQGISDEPKYNVVELHKVKVLKSAAIYGANSSGKSNFIKAMAAMGHYVLSSVKLNDDEALDFTPFLLRAGNEDPSFFEVVFSIQEVKYRYGFELNEHAIVGEWLFKSKLQGKTEQLLFIRTTEGIGVEEQYFPEGKDKEENTNDNRLFLSLCAQLGGQESKNVMGWFQKSFNVISGIQSTNYVAFSKKMLHEQLQGSEEARRFFRQIGLGFTEIATREVAIDPDGLPIKKMAGEREEQPIGGKRYVRLESQHDVYDAQGNTVGQVFFHVKEMESDGTQKLIDLSGPIFDTLIHGKTLVVDELDAKMHPIISHYIIDLFNSPATNQHNAQLIFSTHDTHLLSSKLLRRDQIWFTEKDAKEQTDLYNMMDIVLPDGSKPRNDANYERNYIAGRYGAIPYIVNE